MRILALLALALGCRDAPSYWARADTGLNGREGIRWPPPFVKAQIAAPPGPAGHAIPPNVETRQRMVFPLGPWPVYAASPPLAFQLPGNLMRPPLLTSFTPSPKGAFVSLTGQPRPIPPMVFDRVMPVSPQERREPLNFNAASLNQAAFSRQIMPFFLKFVPEITSSSTASAESSLTVATVPAVLPTTEDPHLNEHLENLNMQDQETDESPISIQNEAEQPLTEDPRKRRGLILSKDRETNVIITGFEDRASRKLQKKNKFDKKTGKKSKRRSFQRFQNISESIERSTTTNSSRGSSLDEPSTERLNEPARRNSNRLSFIRRFEPRRTNVASGVTGIVRSMMSYFTGFRRFWR